MRYTVLGASGFIGSHLAAHLARLGHDCLTPGRGDPALYTEPLGHVVYAVGVTADFRSRPFDTVRAHVCLLAEVLERARFDSLLYLSSTRVYGRAASTAEDAVLGADPANADELYNLSKMTGESLCLASGRPEVRVARLSNVYGAADRSDNFLPSILRDAVGQGRVALRTTLDSAKDYVSIEDVVAVLPRIAAEGRHRLYNVAAGANVSNGALAQGLSRLCGCAVEVAPDARRVVFPPIDTRRLCGEFAFSPRRLPEDLAALVRHYRGQTT